MGSIGAVAVQERVATQIIALISDTSPDIYLKVPDLLLI